MPEPFLIEAAGCRIEEAPLAALLVLRLRRPSPSLLARIGDALGVALPTAPNTTIGMAPRALWLAPGEWMLVDGREVAAPLRAATAGATAHIADVREGRRRFRVSGPARFDLLAKGTSLDLDPEVFGAGSCARTLFAQTQALIDRRDDVAAFDVYADVSLAGHLRRWFADAAVEFGRNR